MINKKQKPYILYINTSSYSMKKTKDENELQSEEKKLQEENIRREKELADYKESLHSLSDEDVKKEEESWIEKLNEFDEYIKGREYELPEYVMYNNIKSKRGEIGKYIAQFFVGKLELEWKFIPGMMELCQWWSNAAQHEKVSYPYLDSTLRILDGFKYKGTDEWNKIILINEYFKQSNAEYHEDVNRLIQLSRMHNAVMDEQQLRAKVETVNEDGKAE